MPARSTTTSDPRAAEARRDGHDRDRDRAPVSMRSPVAIGLVVLMALGSVLMWLVSPVLWLFLASRMTDSSQPSIGPYMLVLVGIVISAVVIGKGLGALNRYHMRLTGLDRGRRYHRNWNRSMRDARQPTRERGLLEPIMAWSVGIALALFLLWFFAFAGSSIG